MNYPSEYVYGLARKVDAWEDKALEGWDRVRGISRLEAENQVLREELCSLADRYQRETDQPIPRSTFALMAKPNTRAAFQRLNEALVNLSRAKVKP